MAIGERIFVDGRDGVGDSHARYVAAIPECILADRYEGLVDIVIGHTLRDINIITC